MDKESIETRLRSIRSRIDAAAKRSGRSGEDITLVAVSKYMPLEFLEIAYEAGQKIFGENYVQEGVQKKQKFEERNLETKFHFIGALQRNKAKFVVGTFDVIETVHKKELAETISKLAVQKGILQEIYIQVNISEEKSKSGALPQEVEGLCREILHLPGLSLTGLMSIGTYVPIEAAEERRGREFVLMRELRDTLSPHILLPNLSMGMSHDFELAIKEGANIVRLGTALFGERPTKG